MAATRGAPTDSVTAGMLVRVIVGMPAVSIARCTSPTDQLQIGQAGIKTTASAPSF